MSSLRSRFLPRVLAGLVAIFPDRAMEALYRAPRLAVLLNRAASAAIGSVAQGTQVVEIQGGPLRGHSMELNLDSEERRMWIGAWEPWVQATIARRLRRDAAAWDVGAYIGYYALLMRKVSRGGRVVAVEPDPDNRRRLRKNLTLNGATDVVVAEEAVAEEEGNATLRLATSERMQSALSPEGGVEVATTTLDALVERYGPPDLVKMDIEGGEADALRGAPRLLREVRPIFVVELHDEAGLEALRILHRAGYATVAPAESAEAVSTHVGRNQILGLPAPLVETQ